MLYRRFSTECCATLKPKKDSEGPNLNTGAETSTLNDCANLGQQQNHSNAVACCHANRRAIVSLRRRRVWPHRQDDRRLKSDSSTTNCVVGSVTRLSSSIAVDLLFEFRAPIPRQGGYCNCCICTWRAIELFAPGTDRGLPINLTHPCIPHAACASNSSATDWRFPLKPQEILLTSRS